MKAWGWLAVLACALALSAPAVAAAQPAEIHPGSFALDIGLPTQDGWRLALTAEDHRHLTLSAYRGSMQIEYTVAGRASSKILRGDFGPLGRVDIAMNLNHVEPPLIGRSRQHRGKRRCRGKVPLGLGGGYRGTIEFAGDAGIPAISTSDGFASVGRTFRTVCGPRKEGATTKRHGISPFGAKLLAARAHSGGRTTTFEAITVDIEGLPLLGLISGGVRERLGRVRIIRRAVEIVQAKELDFGPTSHGGRQIRVRPPRPFTGKASYLREKGTPATWTGDMAVQLPGAGNVTLTGSGFDTTFCKIEQVTDPIQIQRCLDDVRVLRPTTIAGPLPRSLPPSLALWP